MTSNFFNTNTDLTATDRRFFLDGVTWQQYETLRDTLDEFAGLKMTYLEGELELFMPSREHERIKTIIGRLIELYAIVRNIRLYGYGSTTYRQQAKQRGLEPDENYCLDREKPLPDFAIEVVITSGLVDKLDVYRGLDIPEVWVWQTDRIYIYQLNNNRYEMSDRSQFLPDLDLDLLSRCVRISDQHDAAIAFRNALNDVQ
jgi:Uma2 family endonuclease